MKYQELHHTVTISPPARHYLFQRQSTLLLLRRSAAPSLASLPLPLSLSLTPLLSVRLLLFASFTR